MGRGALEPKTRCMNHLSPPSGHTKAAHLSCVGETCHALCSSDAESALLGGEHGDSVPQPLLLLGL